jgi:NAD(P)-dependent dehydrogenase (short-subunit alcohol dehydrogenase family)
MRLDRKIALVTGAAAGIGAATAELFAKEGAKVGVADRDFEQARKVAASIGENAFAIHADVTNANEAKEMVQAIVARFGGLDVLVNNAGLGTRGTVVSIEEDEWDRLINVNLKSVFLVSKYAIPEMSKRGAGSIVNLASTVSVAGIPDRAAYVAAKGGVAALTRAMALDHADQNIRVNSVAPGVTWSNYYEDMLKTVQDPDSFVAGLKARSPLNRYATPYEIATMILFLATDESTFATGGMFTMDGGYTAR